MTPSPLQAATRDFVSVLDDVIAVAIDTDVRFGANLTGDDRRAWIEASRMGVRTSGFPLVRADDDPTAPVLLLKARYWVEMPRGGDHLSLNPPMGGGVGRWVGGRGLVIGLVFGV